MIDWDVAVSTARRLTRGGPRIPYDEARGLAAELRAMVPQAESHVARFTGLPVPDAAVPVAVVDRLGWIQANVTGFQLALEPLLERVASRRGDGSSGGVVQGLGSRLTGVQVGTLMSYLASRVLGQFELFIPPADGDQGRLTLVAPNIYETERRLGVEPRDFRLWVTLHEVTHRAQFTGVPWLRGYFTDQVREFIDSSDLDPAQLVERLRAAAAAVRSAMSGQAEGVSLLEAVQTPQQRTVLRRLQALMSLLEGHGDFVMDGVGPAVVPTAATIRERFDQRRRGAGPVDRLVRRLLGLDLKMRQYAEGERFVRRVVERVGMAEFNRVWTSPHTLPTAEEIAEPDLWIARVVPAEPAEPAVADGRA